jgi:hypothetical protein
MGLMRQLRLQPRDKIQYAYTSLSQIQHPARDVWCIGLDFNVQ